MNIILLLTIAVVCVTGQVRIVRVELNDPPGAIITFKNFGNTPVDVSGYRVGSSSRRIPINSTPNNSFETSGIGPIMPAGGEWSVDYTPWALQSTSTGKLSQSADVSLWRTNVYSEPGNLIDFMQYCNVGNTGTTTCPDFGDYNIATFIGIWGIASISSIPSSAENSHVLYMNTPVVLTYTGDGITRGRSTWTSSSSPISSSTTSRPVSSSPTSVPATAFPTLVPTLASSTSTRSTTTLRPPTTSSASTTSSTTSHVTDSIGCNELEAELTWIHLKIIQLKSRLGC